MHVTQILVFKHIIKVFIKNVTFFGGGGLGELGKALFKTQDYMYYLLVSYRGSVGNFPPSRQIPKV